MPVFATYERRKLEASRAGRADVFEYGEIQPFLRKQLFIILTSSIGPYDVSGYDPRNANSWWQEIARVLEKEVEGFPENDDNAYERCMSFLEREQDIDRWLSFVEVAYLVLETVDDENEYETQSRGATQTGHSAIDEINERFRQHGLGYECQSKEIVRVDSKFVHAQMIKPALLILTNDSYQKADDDFRAAHKHYRAGDWQAAIVAANRAFESTLKAICHQRGWPIPSGARAGELIKTVVGNGLLPDYLDAGLTAYVSMLKTGLPGVRNQAGGHGSAPTDPPVMEHLAGYAINLTAANIVLLDRANNSFAKIGKRRRRPGKSDDGEG
jgi:hypothetical protein